MKKLTATETLKYVMAKLILALRELEGSGEEDEFAYGERTAYVECLEWLQNWRLAAKCGLDYDVETKYPL